MSELLNEKCHDGNIDYYKITDNIWQIEDENGVYCTLVIGRDKAILLDTGFGNKGLKPFIDRHIYTDVMVINSHGHPDHIGGNNAFEYVYASEKEMDIIFDCWNNTHDNEPEFLMRDIAIGTYIDLGDERAMVVDLSGHTMGSIGLLLVNSRILLVGDAFNQCLWLFNKGAMNIASWRESANRALGLSFDYFLGGHYHSVYTKEDIKALLKVSEDISVDASLEKTVFGQKVYVYGGSSKDNKSIMFDARLIGDLELIPVCEDKSDDEKRDASKKEKKGLLSKIFGKV